MDRSLKQSYAKVMEFRAPHRVILTRNTEQLAGLPLINHGMNVYYGGGAQAMIFGMRPRFSMRFWAGFCLLALLAALFLSPRTTSRFDTVPWPQALLATPSRIPIKFRVLSFDWRYHLQILDLYSIVAAPQLSRISSEDDVRKWVAKQPNPWKPEELAERLTNEIGEPGAQILLLEDTVSTYGSEWLSSHIAIKGIFDDDAYITVYAAKSIPSNACQAKSIRNPGVRHPSAYNSRDIAFVVVDAPNLYSRDFRLDVAYSIYDC
jgi:hypothetical protein